MVSKTNQDTFQQALDEREKVAHDTFRDNRAKYDTEQALTDSLEEALETAEEVVEDLEARAKAGDSEVTGKALVEARGDREVAQMALSGNEARLSRLTTWLSKVNTRKDVAEIVKDSLSARMAPGAPAYATFALPKNVKPETLPALVVEQLDGGVRPDGTGEAKVRISWFRGPHHAEVSKDRLRNALEAAGFTLDPRLGFDGLIGRGTADADVYEVGLRGVADEIPVVSTPLADVDGWDFAFAHQINRAFDKIEAVEFGAHIASQDESEGVRTTTVRMVVAARPVTRIAGEAREINTTVIVMGEAEKWVGSVRAGAGRCVEVKRGQLDRSQVTRVQSRSLDLHPLAVEWTFAAKAA